MKGSLGSGINVGLQGGAMLSDNFGIELGVNYLMGSKLTGHDYQDPDANTSDHYDWDETTTMLRIMPGVRFTAGSGDLKPYLRGSVVIGLSGKLTANSKDVNRDILGTTTTETTREFTGGSAMGFGGGLGVGYHSGSLMIFGEISMIAQTWAYTKGVYTKYTVNGQDQLPNMKTYDKETDYVDSYTENSTPNLDAPRQQTKWYQPMSSWGINVGVAFVLGGK